jgi:hypothetical protein
MISFGQFASQPSWISPILRVMGIARPRTEECRPCNCWPIVAGRDRVLAAPEASGRISTACDKLPLALRIAGARLNTRPGVAVTMLAERLEDERAALRNWRSVTCPCTTGCGRATEHSIQWLQRLPRARIQWCIAIHRCHGRTTARPAEDGY